MAKLSVEIVPLVRADIVKFEPAGGAIPEGWGVYIRNPLPLAIRDEWPTVDPQGSAPAHRKAISMALAKSRAEIFAEQLAEHLGAPLTVAS